MTIEFVCNQPDSENARLDKMYNLKMWFCGLDLFARKITIYFFGLNPQEIDQISSFNIQLYVFLYIVNHTHNLPIIKLGLQQDTLLHEA